MKLDITDLEYLEVLVYRGEGLLPGNGHFYQAEILLREGLAEVAATYGPVRRIVPTGKGYELAERREIMRIKKALDYERRIAEGIAEYESW